MVIVVLLIYVIGSCFGKPASHRDRFSLLKEIGMNTAAFYFEAAKVSNPSQKNCYNTAVY